MVVKEVAHWISKVQIRKGTPNVNLTKLVTKPFHLFQGKELECSLAINENGKTIVIISLEPFP